MGIKMYGYKNSFNDFFLAIQKNGLIYIAIYETYLS